VTVDANHPLAGKDLQINIKRDAGVVFMSSLIQISHLYKIFGHDPQSALARLLLGTTKAEIMDDTGHTVALQEVSLSIEAGEIFVVMGLSGSGKSTLIRCVNRLIEPTAGEILVDGQDVLTLDEQALQQFRRHKMSMVFQGFALFPHRTVLDNVTYGLEIQGVAKSERKKRASKWIEIVGLQGWEESLPHQLSGGMQQRVGIARALCTAPEILLMDEPFGALDPLIQREMQNELLDLQRRLQKTIIFITHDLDEALRLGDRIAILKDGLVVQIGTADEILNHPADDYVADFTRDVNRILVLSARSVMVEPQALKDEDHAPEAALKFMEERNLKSVYVVDIEGHLLGLLTASDAKQAIQQEVKGIQNVLNCEVEKTNPETVLEKLIPKVIASKWPVAVVDTQGKLLGIIRPKSVLGGISRA
jgi:glycine betaine/proline transport system ATP-binding protein